MRIEQIIGSYSGFSTRSSPQKPFVKQPDRRDKTAVSIIDALCLSDEDIPEDYTWFSAYVHSLSNETVADKMKQLFSMSATSDSHIEKLIFDIL